MNGDAVRDGWRVLSRGEEGVELVSHTSLNSRTCGVPQGPSFN